MISWPVFAAVFAVFLLTHSLPLRPVFKNRMKQYLGQAGFTVAYSIVSLAMLGALILAARHAPYVSLWPQMIWQRYVVLAGMFVVCVIVALAIARPNPFSFGGAHNDDFDPDHPGIVRFSRHPMLIVLTLWATLHLLANGDLAHVIMFAVLAGFAVLGRWIIDRRKQRLMGPARWAAMVRATQNAPLFQHPQHWGALVLRLGAATVLFITLLALHPIVLGVSPLP